MKKTRIFLSLLTALTMLCGSTLTAFAAEVTYDKGNVITYNATAIQTADDGSVLKTTETGKIQASADYEIVGLLTEYKRANVVTHYEIAFKQIKSASEMYNMQESGLSYYTASSTYYKDGEQTGNNSYTISNVDSGVIFKNGNKYDSVTCSISGCKIFKDSDAMKAYAQSGDTSGVVIMEEYDKSIGYLHGLEYNYLVQTNEEGVPTEAYYQFTWDKYYEEYDNSYSVDIYAVCNLETKQFFGLGSSDIKQSERMHVKTVPYLSDSESGFAEITNSEMNEIFSTFWSAGEKIYESRAWTYDYYFRIVKDGRYGPWTVYDHKYGPLTGSDEADIYVAEDDESGSMTKDTNTEYGSGITYDPNVGVGDTKNDAFEDLLDDETFSPTNINQWFSWLYDVFSGMISSLGQFPQFIGQVFTFLPSEIILLLCAVIVICVVCRLIGR